MDPQILVTLGPRSINQNMISKMDEESVYLFRINMSHTPINKLEDIIKNIRKYTDTDICIDSEGAQIRNQTMANGEVYFKKGDVVKIHYTEVIGDLNNISFTPHYVSPLLMVGDILRIDFNSVKFKVFEKNKTYCLATVESGGKVGSNKATNLNREITLDGITPKDKKAIEIGRQMGINYFALSFANHPSDVQMMREYVGKSRTIISKIESRSGLLHLEGIINESDAVLIDRGDLSREICIEKIPFLQRRIISFARSKKTPVYVATNLLESMITTGFPTRAEVNDVVSTLLMGANGLVLAAETAIGEFPVESVIMIRKLIGQFHMWTPNTSVEELLLN